MAKKLFYSLDNGEGEGGIMELSGCLEWIKGDMQSNYDDSENMPEDELPQYTITPVWMTDEDYEALPEE